MSCILQNYLYKQHRDALYLGKTEHKEMWGQFCQCVGKRIDIGILEEAFLSTPKNSPMLNLARKLHGKHKLGIITDNNKERFDLLNKEWKLSDFFDCIIVSAEIGAKKDSALIFEAALDCMKAVPKECIFIDNNRRNLKIPEKMGFATIFHNHEKNDMALLVKELKRIGVKI